MMFCTKCGAPCEEGTKFCRQCGNPLQQPVQEKPEVQQPVYETAVFDDSMLEQPEPEKSVKPKKEKKKLKHKGLLIFLLIFVALIGIAAALFFFTDTVYLITGQSNNRILVTQEDAYSDNECTYTWYSEFDGSDLVRDWCDDYSHTYVYDGKHNLVSYTESYEIEDYGDEEYKYDVNTYVEDGMTYKQYFDEEGYYCYTVVYDGHGWAVKRLDSNERVTFEREIEYNFFGKITSMRATYYSYYDEDGELSTKPDETDWRESSVEYDGDTMIIRTIDSNDKDEIGDYSVCTYEMYHFW